MTDLRKRANTKQVKYLFTVRTFSERLSSDRAMQRLPAQKQGALSIHHILYMSTENKGGARGSAAMDESKQRESSDKSGKNNPANFANDREKASRAGQEGGRASHGGGQQGGSQNRER